MVSITTPHPSTVVHSSTPVGSQKDKRVADLKVEIAKTPVEKTLTVEHTTENASPQQSETHLKTKADGTRHLVTLQNGVETRQRVPEDHGEKLQVVASETASNLPKTLTYKFFDKSA